MNKSISFLIIISCLLSNNLTAQAQYDNKTAYYINSGLSIPSAPDGFSDWYKVGFNFGGGISYPLTDVFSLRGYYAFNSFKFDEDPFLEDFGLSGLGIEIDGGSFTIIQGTANLKISLPTSPDSKANPYFTGGIGFMRSSIGDITATFVGGSLSQDGDSETAFSIDFGAGLDITINGKTALFFEGTYTIGFTEDESTQYFPIRIGIIFH